MPNAIIAVIAHTAIINTMNNVIGFIPLQAGSPFSELSAAREE